MGSSLAHLLSPGSIGRMALANRIVVTAMGVSLSEADGTCGDRLIAYHSEQAKGGAALIITGVTGVAWPVGAVQPNQTALSDDRFLPGLRRLTDAVHAHGTKIAAQLHHGGLVAGYSAQDGHPLWAPSIPDPVTGDFGDYFLPEEMAAFAGAVMPTVKVLDKNDIAAAVRQFGEAAARAKAAGFDAIEIHSGHGYLLSSFISPKTNKRTDEYGGPLENRIRFLIEVIAAIRAAVGADFPVWCKLDSREIGKVGGIVIEDAIRAARMVESAGVDAITVTAYHDVGQAKLHSGSNIPHEPNFNLSYAAQIKAAVNIPIIASGRVEPEVADARIREGAFDFLAMGRKLLADPHLPRKLAEGQSDDVRPCIYCYTCVSTAYLREPTRCAVNPRTGFEFAAPAQSQGAERKRVVVIGGGPGGMESARRLDAGGHQVVLLEKSDRLGGTLRFASLAYAANERLLDWLRRQIEKSGVDVRLGTTASPELLRSLQPDVVVVATGAVRGMPAIPGNDLPHVFSGDDMRRMMLGETSSELVRKTGVMTRLATKLGAATGVTANLDFVRKATHQWMPLGKRVVIIGGELVGLELAEFLSERGRAVTVVDETQRFGKGLMVVRRMRLLAELKEHGVALHTGATDIRIDQDAVHFASPSGAAHAIPADHVIVAKGASGDLALADQLKAEGFAVHAIGDATGVSYIEGAIRDAAQTADAINAATSGDFAKHA
ncbi:oxidoreductase [Sphingomonas sp. KC8]|uniref:oxidoreductase n=1 Tax=Sphingomonas sp. KC8 TaxID=1030157 RepID=UPI0002F403A6|nr:FAD-dependent oxidoreductase [Sphingomonas sp. KC8]ARS27807.1 NADH:flavin oxidoreductase [Sphingomonas sp. KC8]